MSETTSDVTKKPTRGPLPVPTVDQQWARIDRFSSRIFWSTTVSIVLFVGLYLVGQHLVFHVEHTGYTNKINHSGFVVHSMTGSLYLYLGLIQFHAPTRQRYPAFHRAAGWLYTIISVIAAAGVVVILIGGSMAGESAVLASALYLPTWIILQWLAIRAIQVGDVALHRRHQLRAFALACSVMLTRPVAGFIIAFTVENPDELVHPGDALKTALWFVFSLTMAATEVFLVWEDRAVEKVVIVPSCANAIAVVPLSHVVAPGTVASVLVPPAHAVKSVTVTQLTPRTIRAVLTLADGPYLVVPGQHVAVTATQPNSVIDTALTREYSPTTHPSRALSHHEVELVIRLAPGGAMSARWRAPEQWTWSVTFVPIVPNCAMQRAIAAKDAPVLLVSLGTGATPFVNVIRALAAEKRRVHVVQVHRAIEDMFWSADEWEAMGVDEQLVTSEQQIGRISAQDLVEKVRELDGKGKPDAAGWRVIVSGPQQAARELTLAMHKALGWDEHRIAAVGVDDR
ncbi:hypothetical protein GGF31_005240 [Allomyces arbusculus]|nr:hypothetical protein GGF31_005240 [Allomyces arbusculus]